MNLITKLTERLKQNLNNTFPASLLSFLLAAGCLCGFLSAFDITYDTILVMACLLAASLYLGITAVQKTLLRIAGYGFYFLLYLFGVSCFGQYINTGFYFILNQVRFDLSAYVGAENNQEYQLLSSNSIDAVTIFTIFIGLLLLILITSSVSRKKSLPGAVLYTFPLLAIPIYIRKEPAPVWMIFLVSGYLLVLIFRAQDGKTKKGERKLRLRVRLLLFGYICSLTAVLILVSSLLFPYSAFQKVCRDSALKTAGYESTANFLQFGFSGFFNDYIAAGGMAGGVLGGIYAVRPDYKTDLIVEFAPFNEETLYLRAFTGLVYDERRWIGANELISADQYCPDSSLTRETMLLKTDFEKEMPFSSRELIRIRNTGAVTAYSYTPYYSTESIASAGSYTQYTVYPFHSAAHFAVLPKKERDFYLSVPDKNKEVLKKLCFEKQLNGSVDETIAKIKDLFAQEYTYTLMPGKTPGSRDVVNYFLTDSKKGYCAHFASSAVLLLRTLGIPARYVEGYALQTADMADGILLKNKNYADYHQGYHALGETGVLRCEINDSQAHAWVEYFDEDFGWRTAEFTPAQTEEDESDGSGFWNSLAGLFYPAADPFPVPSASTAPASSGKENKAASPDSFFDFLPLLIKCLSILLFCTAILWYYKTYLKCRNVKDLFRVYGITCDRIRKKYPLFSMLSSHEEQLNFINEHFFSKNSRLLIPVPETADMLEVLSYAEPNDIRYSDAYKKKRAKQLRTRLWLTRWKLLFKKV